MSEKEPVLKGAPEEQILFPEVDNSDTTPDPKPDPNAVKIAELEAEITAGKEREAKNQEVITNMSKQQATPAPTQEPTVPKPTVEAPDPVVDPEGFRAHIKSEIKEDMNAEFGVMRAETLKTNANNQLWVEFARNHKDLAENYIDLVKFQATEILQEVARSGQDPQQYLMISKGAFMDDVASRATAMISKIKGESLDTGRTDGVLSSSPRTITPKPKEDENKSKDFIKQLQEAQMATGFF